MANQSTLETFEAAVAGATNDECVEMTLRLFKEVGHRCDRLAGMVLEVDDRDAVNEAFAFVSAADDVVPSLKWSEPRIDKPARRIQQAKTRLDKAIKRRGRIGPIPWEEKTPEERHQEAVLTVQERDRKWAEGDKLLAKVDFSRPAVLNALQAAIADSPDGLTRARDVALKLLPKATDPKTPGRQRLIARVGKVMRELAADGQLEQLRPDQDPLIGRETCRFKLKGSS